MYLWPTLASVCTYLIALSVLVPLFGAVERASADNENPGPAPAPTSEAPAQRSTPNFSVAVGTNDQAQEMPAIQSAMTDYLSFSDEFFAQLKQGAVAPDFATSEREVSPDTARDQVKEGTAVLAVILPKDLTPKVINDITAYYRGDIDVPHYAVKILASPQSLTDDKMILRQYRDQVIRQAGEHVSEQIRTVARKLGCTTESRPRCPRSQEDAERAFETPFEINVEQVAGPAPVDYFGARPSDESAKPETSSTTDTDETQSTTRHRGQSIDSKLSAVISAIIISAVVLAVTSSAVVNRAAGLHLVIIGPWRSLQPQRPFPRRMLLGQKYGLAAAGAVVLTAIASTSTTWPGQNVAESFGAYPTLRMIAVIGFLCLVCLTLSVTILSVTDTVGSLFGAIVALAFILWGTAGSFLVELVDPGSTSLWLIAEMLIGGNRRAIIELAPTFSVLLVVLATAFIGSLLATGAFDRKFSTQIDHGNS